MPNSASAVETAISTYPGVTSVEPLSGHRLLLEFDNGEKRVFDATPLLTFGRFETLSTPETFKQVRVAFDTVEWENGLDLDPEYLYGKSKPLPREQGACTGRGNSLRSSPRL